MRRKLIVICGTLIVLCAGCKGDYVGKETNTSQEQSTEVATSYEEGRNEKIKQGDFKLEFACWYNDERKNVFSTYDNYIQKDLIDMGVVREEWHISYGDVKELEKIVREYNLCEYNGKYMSEGLMTPMKEFYIKFSLDGEEYIIEGNETIVKEGRTKSEENENFCEALEKLEYIFKNQKTYSNMPNSEGGYD